MLVNVNMALFTCLFHYVPDDQMLIKNKFLYVTKYNYVCKSPYEVCAVKMRLYTNRTKATTKKNVGFLTVMPLGRKVLGIVDAWNNLNGKRESVEAPPHPPPPFHPETTRGLLIQLEKKLCGFMLLARSLTVHPSYEKSGSAPALPGSLICKYFT